MGEDKNEKTTRLNLLSRLEVTSASQTNGVAKIIINNDIAILKSDFYRVGFMKIRRELLLRIVRRCKIFRTLEL